jgi:hypothetical protein
LLLGLWPGMAAYMETVRWGGLLLGLGLAVIITFGLLLGLLVEYQKGPNRDVDRDAGVGMLLLPMFLSLPAVGICSAAVLSNEFSGFIGLCAMIPAIPVLLWLTAILLPWWSLPTSRTGLTSNIVLAFLVLGIVLLFGIGGSVLLSSNLLPSDIVVWGILLLIGFLLILLAGLTIRRFGSKENEITRQ